MMQHCVTKLLVIWFNYNSAEVNTLAVILLAERESHKARFAYLKVFTHNISVC